MKFPSLPLDPDETSVGFAFHEIDRPDIFDEISEVAVDGWLAAVAKTYGRRIDQLDYVFCSDDFLAGMNVEHLDHDTLTDIITFDLAEDSPSTGAIEGECYISVERVTENAQRFGESPQRELLRVLAHGLLHLCGLGDETDEEAAQMRIAEAAALQNWEASS